MVKKKGSIIPKILVAVMLCYAVISIVTIGNQKKKAEEQYMQLAAQVEEQQRVNEELQQNIENSDDPETIAKIARDKLGMVASNETVFYDIGS